MSDRNIVIDLNFSNHNRPVSSGAELIQREAFDALRLQIRKDLAQAKSKAYLAKHQSNVEREDMYPHGSGLTYFIDGTRGAGNPPFCASHTTV